MECSVSRRHVVVFREPSYGELRSVVQARCIPYGLAFLDPAPVYLRLDSRRYQELVAWHRKTAIRTVCWINHGTRSEAPKNFSLYFCLDRPQYLVVLTNHSLDAMSEMR